MALLQGGEATRRRPRLGRGPGFQSWRGLASIDAVVLQGSSDAKCIRQACLTHHRFTVLPARKEVLETLNNLGPKMPQELEEQSRADKASHGSKLERKFSGRKLLRS